MSSAVFFLLFAAALMSLGFLWVWFTHRAPPPSDRDSVAEFSRNRQALDPKPVDDGPSPTREG